ncbi:glycosyltransferase family 2 protein [Candidatus Woesearchaeota archaeon]|nr:glycosyltransferase family 2 protein [Candidatus Woesearchaeota archaeon]
MATQISILIPVYNEENAVASTIDSIKKVMKQAGKSYEIIAINDCSTDSSGKILSEIEGIELIHNPYNVGYGASLKKGINAAKGDLIAITDADGTYPIDKLPELLKYADQYDMVVGAREKNVKDHLGRRPAKWLLKALASFLAQRKIPDINSGFRIFRKDKAKEFMHLYPAGFSLTTTITLAFLSNDYTVKYVKIPYYKRVGKSSIRPIHFINFITLIVKLFIYFRPVRMITPIALLFFVLGILKSVRDFYLIGTIGSLAIILILVSIQVLILALIAEAVIKSRS